jgi:hypothetical protein
VGLTVNNQLDDFTAPRLELQPDKWVCDICGKPIAFDFTTKARWRNEGAWIKDFMSNRPGLRAFGHRGCIKHLRQRGDYWVEATLIRSGASNPNWHKPDYDGWFVPELREKLFRVAPPQAVEEKLDLYYGKIVKTTDGIFVSLRDSRFWTNQSLQKSFMKMSNNDWKLEDDPI